MESKVCRGDIGAARVHRLYGEFQDLFQIPQAEKAAAYGLRGEVADTVSGALARAREMASEEDMIFIGGSNFVVAEVLE